VTKRDKNSTPFKRFEKFPAKTHTSSFVKMCQCFHLMDRLPTGQRAHSKRQLAEVSTNVGALSYFKNVLLQQFKWKDFPSVKKDKPSCHFSAGWLVPIRHPSSSPHSTVMSPYHCCVPRDPCKPRPCHTAVERHVTRHQPCPWLHKFTDVTP